MYTEPAGFFKRKTTWAALLAILTATAGGLTGTISPAEALQTATTALIGLGLRSAIAKK